MSIFLFSLGINAQEPNFEICNKTKENIYYKIKLAKGMTQRPIEFNRSLLPNKAQEYVFDYAKAEERYFLIKIASDKDFTKNSRTFILNIASENYLRTRPVETVFIKVIKKNGSFFVEAQKPRGLFGATTKTCRGLKLDQYKNITDADIRIARQIIPETGEMEEKKEQN